MAAQSRVTGLPDLVPTKIRTANVLPDIVTSNRITSSNRMNLHLIPENIINYNDIVLDTINQYGANLRPARAIIKKDKVIDLSACRR